MILGHGRKPILIISNQHNQITENLTHFQLPMTKTPKNQLNKNLF